MNLAPHQVLSERWRLVDFIGEGAMGEVWRGRHVVLGHEVAIKLMKHDAAHDREMSARFLREARIAAQLRHKNLVRVEDFGTAGDGRPYLVMELLHGRSLGNLLVERGQLDRAAAALIAAHVGAACDVAHGAGIVHRDLKPDNCFVVSDDDGQPLVKVLDFGVAKVTDSLFVTANGIVTASHALLGTPMYMSPEQARGQPDLDGRSDLWSLAVIVYEMLTGRMPYEAPTISQLLYAVLAGPIPPPSSIDPSLGPPLDAWFVRALHRDRNQRFQSGREMAQALAGALGVALPAPSMVPAVPGLERAPRPYGITPQGALPAASGAAPVDPSYYGHGSVAGGPGAVPAGAMSYASAGHTGGGSITGVKPVVSTVVLPPGSEHANVGAHPSQPPPRAHSVTPPTAYQTAVPTPAAAYYTAAEPSGLHRIVPAGASSTGVTPLPRTEAMPAMPVPPAAFGAPQITPPPPSYATGYPAAAYVAPVVASKPVSVAPPPMYSPSPATQPLPPAAPAAVASGTWTRSGVLLMLVGVLAGITLTFVVARAARHRHHRAASTQAPIAMPAPVPLAPMYAPQPPANAAALPAIAPQDVADGGVAGAPSQGGPLAPRPSPRTAPSSSASTGNPGARRHGGDGENGSAAPQQASPGEGVATPGSGGNDHASEYNPDAM